MTLEIGLIQVTFHCKRACFKTTGTICWMKLNRASCPLRFQIQSIFHLVLLVPYRLLALCMQSYSMFKFLTFQTKTSRILFRQKNTIKHVLQPIWGLRLNSKIGFFTFYCIRQKLKLFANWQTGYFENWYHQKFEATCVHFAQWFPSHPHVNFLSKSSKQHLAVFQTHPCQQKFM